MTTQFPVGGAPSPVSPWHMWGTTERFDLTIGVGGSIQVVGHQMAKITYRRPETWRFFFGGRLLSGIAGVGGSIHVYALFDVLTGVGRSLFDTQDRIFTNFRSFCTMHWIVPVGVIPGAQPDNVKYTTSVPTTPLDDAVADRETIDLLPAQDISVRARMYIDLAPSNVTVQAELSCYFAPNVHVRPDWYKDAPDQALFAGGETGGT